MTIQTPVRRVAIVGPSGAGKSTLARALAASTGLPLIHLDREYWGPHWEPTPEALWAEKLARIVAGKRSIIDGNYGGAMQARLDAADTIIFIDVGTLTSLYRVLKCWVTYRGPG